MIAYAIWHRHSIGNCHSISNRHSNRHSISNHHSISNRTKQLAAAPYVLTHVITANLYSPPCCYYSEVYLVSCVTTAPSALHNVCFTEVGLISFSQQALPMDSIETRGQKDRDAISKQHGDTMPSSCHSEKMLWNPSIAENIVVSLP